MRGMLRTSYWRSRAFDLTVAVFVWKPGSWIPGRRIVASLVSLSVW